ncbi:MAG TPA: C40 family peptidase [Dermatophilaceae bacterium]|nr:C40 family peptidase [Dermatophilaceae bacterium]
MLAVSGGMVASFGLPASAEAVQPQAAPPAGGVPAAGDAATPVALAAPAAGTAVAAPAFGKIGFTAVKKKVILPRVDLLSRVVVRAPTARVSRSADRRPLASSSPSRTSSYRSVAPAASGVLGIAASLLGIPYVYGGSTPAGFDCSGFTSYVFRQVGISLPRTAAAQQAAATRVSSPQPGDLVFYGYPAYHVGIYAGNGMMYDSPRTGLSSGLRRIFSGSVSYGRP